MQEVGKQAVAISTIALIVLMISGIAVYWATIKRAFLRALLLVLNIKRAFLSTMHSAIGMWVIPFICLFHLTGIIMSYDVVKDTLYNMAGVQKPQKMQGMKSQGKRRK